jgi:hypothetical protein
VQYYPKFVKEKDFDEEIRNFSTAFYYTAEAYHPNTNVVLILKFIAY